MSNRFNKASLMAGTIMAGAVIAVPAHAQNAEDVAAEAAAEENNVMIVTGSRIRQRNVETAAPIAVVDAEEFELSGTVNVENVVNTLPQVIPGFTSNSNNPGTGAATLDLRGLGSARTLVLVNGRRWLSFDTSQIVDLNTIPNFLLDSVDVVTGGASAVYGSDALAGVVNFRLREVDGVELGGQYSLTSRGDGARYQLHGAIGTSFDDGRGSATVFAEYFNRSEVFQGDRSFSNFAIGGETFDFPLIQFGSSTVPQGRINSPGSSAISADADDLNENGLCDPGEGCGILAQGLVIDDGIFDTPGSPRARAGDTYNYAPVNYLQIPQERYLLGGYADYEFQDGHSFYTEVAYVNNRVATELAATPVTGTFDVDIATVSQFLGQDAIDQLNTLDQNEATVNAQRVEAGLSPLAAPELGVVSTFIQRRMLEAGPRNSLDERNAFRILGGVRGDVSDNIQYDAYYMFARTRNANVQQGNISRSAFQAGLDGTGLAINPFGQGTFTPEMIAALQIQAQNGDISSVEVASGSISGFLGDLGLGGGDVGFALGAEYRRVGSQFIPDTALSSGDVIGFNAGESTEGAYDVKEIFAEVNIPVIETDAGMRLELTGQGRYSDYSLEAVGGVWSYAGGVEFQPIPDITLRGQYQRAVRAPNVGELFGGQAIGFPTTTDPCGDQDFIDANAGSEALCVATGVPAGNVGNANAVQLNAQIPALFGGNPELQEETSSSWTVGAVFQPEFVPGLTITADYFDITISDAISIAGGSLQGLLNLCYGEVQDINSAVCQPFVGVRNADGAITVDNPPLVAGVNIAELGVSGVDLQVNYGTDIPFSLMGSGDSRINVNFLGTWTESSFFQPVQELPNVIECAGLFAGECGEPTPEFKWTSRFSWQDGPLTTSVRWRHLGSVDSQDSILADPNGIDYTEFGGVNQIDSYDLIDLTLSYEASENFTLAFGVNNLFDTLPGTPEFDGIFVTNRPNSLLLGDNQEQANTYPSTYDVIGRDFFVSASFKF